MSQDLARTSRGEPDNVVLFLGVRAAAWLSKRGNLVLLGRSAFDGPSDLFYALFHLSANLFLPKAKHKPTASLKFAIDPPVPRAIAFNFFDPKVTVAAKAPAQLRPVSAVPEGAVTKDSNFCGNECNVWAA